MSQNYETVGVARRDIPGSTEIASCHVPHRTLADKDNGFLERTGITPKQVLKAYCEYVGGCRCMLGVTGIASLVGTLIEHEIISETYADRQQYENDRFHMD